MSVEISHFSCLPIVLHLMRSAQHVAHQSNHTYCQQYFRPPSASLFAILSSSLLSLFCVKRKKETKQFHGWLCFRLDSTNGYNINSTIRIKLPFIRNPHLHAANIFLLFWIFNIIRSLLAVEITSKILNLCSIDGQVWQLHFDWLTPS